MPGGGKRQESVQAGLAACDIDTRYVIVHDGARPCVTPDTISDVVKAVKRFSAVTLGRRMTDTVKRIEKGSFVAETLDRDKLWTVQTPQAFLMKTIRAAYKALGDREVTDDCQAVELAGETVKVLESCKPNFKITTVEDLQVAGEL